MTNILLRIMWRGKKNTSAACRSSICFMTAFFHPMKPLTTSRRSCLRVLSGHIKPKIRERCSNISSIIFSPTNLQYSACVAALHSYLELFWVLQTWWPASAWPSELFRANRQKCIPKCDWSALHSQLTPKILLVMWSGNHDRFIRLAEVASNTREIRASEVVQVKGKVKGRTKLYFWCRE